MLEIENQKLLEEEILFSFFFLRFYFGEMKSLMRQRRDVMLMHHSEAKKLYHLSQTTATAGFNSFYILFLLPYYTLKVFKMEASGRELVIRRLLSQILVVRGN